MKQGRGPTLERVATYVDTKARTYGYSTPTFQNVLQPMSGITTSSLPRHILHGEEDAAFRRCTEKQVLLSKIRECALLYDDGTTAESTLRDAKDAKYHIDYILREARCGTMSGDIAYDLKDAYARTLPYRIDQALGRLRKEIRRNNFSEAKGERDIITFYLTGYRETIGRDKLYHALSLRKFALNVLLVRNFLSD